MKYGFGVDLGGTTVKIAYFNESGDLLEKWEIPTVTKNDGQQILPDIAASILTYMKKESIDPQQLLGVGIGVPGPVTPNGVVNKCINLGWGIFNIEQTLSNMLNLPVKAGNDANVAALGESWLGSGGGCQNAVMVTLGTGVGGGIIVDGKVIAGVHGAGGEIGHITINREETQLCSCGKRGCVEQYCSATGVVRIAKQVLENSQAQSCMRNIEPLTCKDVFDCANADDALAKEALAQVYAYLGEFLANVCNVVNPEVIIIGGGVSKAGQCLIDGLRPHFDKHIFHAAKDVRFALASLGNDAGACGAFKLILDR